MRFIENNVYGTITFRLLLCENVKKNILCASLNHPKYLVKVLQKRFELMHRELSNITLKKTVEFDDRNINFVHVFHQSSYEFMLSILLWKLFCCHNTE